MALFYVWRNLDRALGCNSDRVPQFACLFAIGVRWMKSARRAFR
jgi:hypothetical protein